VFVDDLDRCAPNKVADVVEAINLFLCGDYPNCIFVLGMEPGMVAAALEVANKEVIDKAEEMGLTDGGAPVGWRFMDKIVQLPIMIPPPMIGAREIYVDSLTGFASLYAAVDVTEPGSAAEAKQRLMQQEEAARASVVAPLNEEEVRGFVGELQGANLAEVVSKTEKKLAAVAPEKRPAVAEASKRVYADTFNERDATIVNFVKQMAERVGGNPRQIKRYVNVLRYYLTLRHGLWADRSVAEEILPTPEAVAKFVGLSILWPHAVDCLRMGKNEIDGELVTRLEFLERKSREMKG
jgi:hypothetical protein